MCTVAGRGVGCGRIPEHRLLMDQLVPASYLQLEDTVRNISLIMRLQGKPPVLTYKELRYRYLCVCVMSSVHFYLTLPYLTGMPCLLILALLLVETLLTEN